MKLILNFALSLIFLGTAGTIKSENVEAPIGKVILDSGPAIEHLNGIIIRNKRSKPVSYTINVEKKQFVVTIESGKSWLLYTPEVSSLFTIYLHYKGGSASGKFAHVQFEANDGVQNPPSLSGESLDYNTDTRIKEFTTQVKYPSLNTVSIRENE